MFAGLLGTIFVVSRMMSLIAPTLDVQVNVPYKSVGSQVLTMDIIAPAGAPGPLPAVVAIHGGGWLSGDKGNLRTFSRRVARQGVVVATINFRQLPQWPFPSAVSDARDAVRFLRDNASQYRVDPDRIGVFGSSSGGQIAGLVAFAGDEAYFDEFPISSTSPAVQAGVLVFATANLEELAARPAMRPFLELYLGDTFEENPSLFRLASVVNHVNQGDPPTLLIHGLEDSVVPHSQSVAIYSALLNNGTDASIILRRGKRHGFTRLQPREMVWMSGVCADYFVTTLASNR